MVLGTASNASFLEPAYLAFNTMVVIGFNKIPLADRHFRRALIGAIITGTLIATIYAWDTGASIMRVGGSVWRSVGTFNNPNQQGFFAVCIASIAGLLYLRDIISRKMCLFLWGAALILAMVSVSRAAAAAIVVLLIFGIAAMLNKRRLSPAVILASLTILAGIWIAYSAGLLDQVQSVARIEQTGSNRYDSLVVRGYTIPFHNPLEFLFGVGAENARVGTKFYSVEVHSTWWSFMGKYGIIGFALFVAVWLTWTRSIYRELGLLGVLIVVLPATINGISGNYSRFTALWVLVGLSINGSFFARRQQALGPQARRPFEGVAMPAYPNGPTGQGANPASGLQAGPARPPLRFPQATQNGSLS